MPVFELSTYVGRVTWLGRVANREASLTSQPCKALAFELDGAPGESHSGMTRPSCSRVSNVYPRGTAIANSRQVSVLSVEELAVIAERMGLDQLDPALVGATMVIEGIPDLTHLPPSSRLQIAGGATFVVDVANRPCVLPARPIEDAHAGFGAKFKAAGKGKRGFVGWVESSGLVQLGDEVRLFIPDQPQWSPTLSLL